MRSTSRSSSSVKEGSGKLPSFVFRAVTYRNGRLFIIDQTRLPAKVARVEIKSALDAVLAIKRLAVRGAPCLGVAAAYALAVEARRLPDNRLESGVATAANRLERARPTAVNLAWAVRRVMRAFLLAGPGYGGMRRALEEEASRIEAEEVSRSLAMSAHGARLVPRNGKILTICNTGALAGPGLGTALGVVFQAYLAGKRPRVFIPETRPLLQGARLTALELRRAGIDSTLIVDSAAATVMPECNLVLVGADRIARNGDTANKIGTRMLAIIARQYDKPFYVVAPSSTFDPSCPNGAAIRVEERDALEVTTIAGRRVVAAGVKVFNPAFDVTPARLVTGIVTETGLISSPYPASIVRMLNLAQSE